MKPKLLAVAGIVVLSAFISRAQPYYVVGDYNSWANPSDTAMTDNGPVNGVEQYSYQVTNQTPNAYPPQGFKVTDGTWNNAWPGNNLFLKYDNNGNATIYFYPGNISDGWVPTANRVGYADPGNMTWEITGDFTTPAWGGGDGTQSDPNAQLTLEAGSNGVYTNIYVIAVPGTYNFKFRTPGTWSEVNFGSDFGNGGGNAVVTTTTSNQAVLFQLDLPNGRWQAGGPPVYCDVQFSVDMSLVAQSDPGFDPSSVTINGDALNGWSGTACTNDPTAANTNVYTSPYFHLQVGTAVQYQFRYLSDGQTQYDAKGGVSGVNRTFTVPNVASTNVPTVFWDDALPTDVLNVDTTVTFTLNMTNAVGVTNGVPEHVFDPANDYVFVNGDFAGWLNWDPITLFGAGLELENNPPGSELYTYTVTFPAGHARALTYKYSINGNDDEAGFAQNHFRYIRSTNGVYNLPMDTFGVMYNEPKVGGLTIGNPSGGVVPINWLSYPNVNLQMSTDLTTWQDVPNTVGGSSTNWPVGSGNAFFRLIQP
ncbi:MAG TPA: hypothetical protein VHG71_11315 [Verrucomicrobiae bacterium]|nr:hypothetical protein [Verrucomicrobiae bacterium]